MQRIKYIDQSGRRRFLVHLLPLQLVDGGAHKRNQILRCRDEDSSILVKYHGLILINQLLMAHVQEFLPLQAAPHPVIE